uniref:Uncharacterized protein n=1 Tax=Latimeria chalumnae TaxID=7897 RepID=H3ACB7_LATCH
MDENSNPEEIMLSLRKEKLSQGELEAQLNHLNSRMRTKSGAWESNGYAPDQEIESFASRDPEETSPLSSSNGLNIRNRKLLESSSGGGPKPLSRPPSQNHLDYKTKPFSPSFRSERRGYRDFEKKFRDGKWKDWNSAQNGMANGHYNDAGSKMMGEVGGSENRGGYRRWRYRQSSRDSRGSMEERAASPLDERRLVFPKQELDRSRSAARTPERSGSWSGPSKPSGRFASPSSYGMKSEAESQRKGAEAKACPPPTTTTTKKLEERPKPKVSPVALVDGTWSLCKPPPAFPVDNSSAKIVPRISYASKVKENLNKTVVETDVQYSKLPQVPTSAVKTVAATGLPNGLPANTMDAHLSTPASPPPTCADLLKAQDVAPLAENGHRSSPEAPASQHSLGAIFQNEWGLSFINEPNADPGRSRGFPSAETDTCCPFPPGTPQASQCETAELNGQCISGSIMDSGDPFKPGLVVVQPELRGSERWGGSSEYQEDLPQDDFQELIRYHLKGKV